MNKIILLSLIASLSLASSITLQEKLNSLEKEIKQLKEQVNGNAQDLDEYIPVIERSEMKSIMDKINFSPELELRMDKMNYQVGTIEGEDTKIYGHSDPSLNGLQRRDEYSKSFSPAVAIRFNLNMLAKISDEVSFNGRLTYANSTQSYQRLCILSRDIKSNASSSAFDVDRAYVDYTSSVNSEYAFTFTFGILPTSGGTPMQYAQDTQRNSMFPALVFDMNTYGVIATQKLGTDNFLRAIVAKGYTLRNTFYPYQCNRENIDNANVAGLYFDTKIDFLGKSLLSFGVNYLGSFKAHPYLGPDVSSSDSQVLGDMLTFGLGLDVENIQNSGLTFFAHSALSNPHGNGKSEDYQIDSSNPAAGLTIDGTVGFSEADYAQGEMLSDNGYSFYLGARYDISTTFNLGAEYNHGSKYWFSATQGAEDMFNKLATRGDVTELYTMWKFHKYMYLKLGYMHTNENYTGSGWHFGEPARKDATQQDSYISLKAEF